MKKSKRDASVIKGGAGCCSSTPQHELDRGGGGTSEDCEDRCRMRESGHIGTSTTREKCTRECSFLSNSVTMGRLQTPKENSSPHCSTIARCSGSCSHDSNTLSHNQAASTSKFVGVKENTGVSGATNGALHADGAPCSGRCMCSCHCSAAGPAVSSITSNPEPVVVMTTPPTSPHKSHGGLLGTLRKKFSQMMKRDSPSSEQRPGTDLIRVSPRAKSTDRANCSRSGGSRSRTLPRKGMLTVAQPSSGPSTPAAHANVAECASFDTFDLHRGRSFRRQRSKAADMSATPSGSNTLSPTRLHRIVACPSFSHDSYRSHHEETVTRRGHSSRKLTDVEKLEVASGAVAVPDTGYGHTSAPTVVDFDGNEAAAVPVVGPLPPYYDQVKDANLLGAASAGWSLTRELFKLPKYGWYWGPIARSEAEERLAGQPDGAFLLRDSSDDRYLLSLSFRSDGRTLHTRIEHCNGLFSFYAQPESEGYSSVVDLIERSMSDSQSGVFCYSRARTPGSPSFPVRLARPVSRFTQVRTLQYLCRFVIRQHTRVDYIQKLPLPTSIKGWLEETQY